MLIFVAFFLLTTFITAGVVGLGYSEQQALFIAEAALGLSFPLSVLVYMRYYKRLTFGEIASQLGLTSDKLSLRMVGIGIGLFLVVMAVTIIIGLLGFLFGQTINTNVSVALAGAPAWFYAFSAVIEPINEEVLFRGFMVPRLGIIVSAIIFGLGHLGYNSTFEVEVIVAVVFGLIAGYVFKKTNSLYPSIIAHILVNSIAVLALVL